MLRQCLEDGVATKRLDVGEHDVGVNQVEFAIDQTKAVIGSDEVNVVDSVALAIAPCLCKHRWRNIHADGAPAISRKGNQEAAHATTEVKRGLGRKVGLEAHANRL